MLRKILGSILGTSTASAGPGQAGPQPVASIPQGPLRELAQSVQQYAHPDFPFLHRDYSPGSRVPCADITPFIIDRLRHSDPGSIQSLMMQLVAGNPGLGIGPSWAGEAAVGIAGESFEQFLAGDHADTHLELKALFTVAAKDGGGREFWLTDDKALLFSYAVCCDGIRWVPSMEGLRQKANAFIRKMRKDTPYWVEYPLFEEACWQVPQLNHDSLDDQLRDLPLGARIHLLSLAAMGKGDTVSLIQSTTYSMRSLGVNPLQTADILLASGFCLLTEDVQALGDVWTKEQLVAILGERQIDYKKSWDKRRLLAALGDGDPDFVRETCAQHKTAKLDPEHEPLLRARAEHAQSTAKAVALLFFT